MSIVKYTNKKTGVITLYESTSHYDPETKQSRPIRKYLGKEDPVTGELIPSSGKRGRKKNLQKPMAMLPFTPMMTRFPSSRPGMKKQYQNGMQPSRHRL